MQKLQCCVSDANEVRYVKDRQAGRSTDTRCKEHVRHLCHGKPKSATAQHITHRSSIKCRSTHSRLRWVHGKRSHRHKVMSQQIQQVQGFHTQPNLAVHTPNRSRICPMSIKARHSNHPTSLTNLTGLRHNTSLTLCGYSSKPKWV
jgi:hypothetical protein